jgi:hypothetical protein
MIKVCFFDTKPYDKVYFDRMVQGLTYERSPRCVEDYHAVFHLLYALAVYHVMHQPICHHGNAKENGYKQFCPHIHFGKQTGLGKRVQGKVREYTHHNKQTPVT